MARPCRVPDDVFAVAVANSPNLHRLLLKLGMAPRGANYETVRARIRALGLDAGHLHRDLRATFRLSDAQVRDAIATSRSFAQALTRLGYRPGGRIQAEFKRRVSALGLDTSHFSGQGWRLGSRNPVVPALSLSKILVEGRYSRTSNLKRRLLEAGLKQPQCEVCGGTRWRDQPMPLELDHVNGRRDDDRLSNLRLLCPNCHAQTETYRGRNMTVGRRYSLGARVPER